jgi:pyrroline-5-carboxylate reductase
LERIGVIGGGNMGSALIRGLVGSGRAQAEMISAFDVDRDKLSILEKELGIRVVDTVEKTVGPDTGMIVLAVKPQNIAEVLDSIADRVHDGLLIVSIAAGISTTFILSKLRRPARVIRAMPNAAALVSRSATALCKGGTADDGDMRKASDIFSAIGSAVTVDEKMMNLVTGLSGSGPAYIFAVMEGLTDAGVLMGLDRPTARAFKPYWVRLP